MTSDPAPRTPKRILMYVPPLLHRNLLLVLTLFCLRFLWEVLLQKVVQPDVKIPRVSLHDTVPPTHWAAALSGALEFDEAADAEDMVAREPDWLDRDVGADGAEVVV